MKILFVITGLGVGGAERQVSDLAVMLSRTHEVCVCFLTGRQEIEVDSPHVQLMGLGIEKSLGSLLHGIEKFRRLVCDFKPDVVHSHMVHANIFARLMRFMAPFPRLISSAHSTYEGGRLRMMAYAVTHKLADVTTNVSVEAVQAFEKQKAVPNGQMIVMYNGVNTDRFLVNPLQRRETRDNAALNDSDMIILVVGRLVPAKDYANLLDAFALVSKQYTDCILWIAGGGPDEAYLKRYAEQLRLQDKVKFLGVRHDVAALYNAADIYVLSSAWEGFGLVVAEAMASQKPVIATDAGGVSEVLGDCGFLVPVQDHVSLAAAIKKVLELTCEERNEIGAAARRRIVNQFALTAVCTAWESLYKNHPTCNKPMDDKH
jgi:glycosyltransferase involved in cell wall biosynthesis